MLDFDYLPMSFGIMSAPKLDLYTLFKPLAVPSLIFVAALAVIEVWFVQGKRLTMRALKIIYFAWVLLSALSLLLAMLLSQEGSIRAGAQQLNHAVAKSVSRLTDELLAYGEACSSGRVASWLAPLVERQVYNGRRSDIDVAVMQAQPSQCAGAANVLEDLRFMIADPVWTREYATTAEVQSVVTKSKALGLNVFEHLIAARSTEITAELIRRIVRYAIVSEVFRPKEEAIRLHSRSGTIRWLAEHLIWYWSILVLIAAAFRIGKSRTEIKAHAAEFQR